MEILKMVFVWLILVSIILKVLAIGDDREPITKGEAIIEGIANSALIYVLLN